MAVLFGTTPAGLFCARLACALSGRFAAVCGIAVTIVASCSAAACAAAACLTVGTNRGAVTAMIGARLRTNACAAAIRELTALQFASAVHAFLGFAAFIQAFTAILVVTGDIGANTIAHLARRIANDGGILVDAVTGFTLLIRTADVAAAAAVLVINQEIHAFAVTRLRIGIFAIHHDILARSIDALLIVAAGICIAATAVQRIGLGIDACRFTAAGFARKTAFIAAFQIFRFTGERVAASLLRFTAIGWIVVAVEIAVLAFAAAANAKHVAAAGIITVAAVLGIAQKVVANAVAKRIVVGTANHAIAVLARFVVFALRVAVAAVCGIRLNIDAAAHAIFLAAGSANAAGRCTAAIHASLVCFAGMTAAAAVLSIHFDIRATLSAHHGIIAA